MLTRRCCERPKFSRRAPRSLLKGVVGIEGRLPRLRRQRFPSLPLYYLVSCSIVLIEFARRPNFAPVPDVSRVFVDASARMHSVTYVARRPFAAHPSRRPSPVQFVHGERTVGDSRICRVFDDSRRFSPAGGGGVKSNGSQWCINVTRLRVVARKERDRVWMFKETIITVAAADTGKRARSEEKCLGRDADHYAGKYWLVR